MTADADTQRPTPGELTVAFAEATVAAAEMVSTCMAAAGPPTPAVVSALADLDRSLGIFQVWLRDYLPAFTSTERTTTP